jgi:hypothetical protein
LFNEISRTVLAIYLDYADGRGGFNAADELYCHILLNTLRGSLKLRGIILFPKRPRAEDCWLGEARIVEVTMAKHIHDCLIWRPITLGECALGLKVREGTCFKNSMNVRREGLKYIFL